MYTAKIIPVTIPNNVLLSFEKMVATNPPINMENTSDIPILIY